MYVHPGGGSTPQAFAEEWLKAKTEGWTAGKGAFIQTHNDVIDRVGAVRERGEPRC